MAEYGHTFASDLAINYVHMRREGANSSGAIVVIRFRGDRFHLGGDACPSVKAI
jgi:hypothetical protein